MLLKVSDNYSSSLVGNFGKTATTITVDAVPEKTVGYLTIFDLDGNQLEKIKYLDVDGLNLTGCIRGLSFEDNSDTPVVDFAKELKNGMSIKMTVSQHYINPIIDVLNATTPTPAVLKNPAARVISDSRHLVDKEYADAISAAGIVAMLVSDNGGVTVNINPGTYLLNGVVKVYLGSSAQALTDDATNYIQLTDGILAINTTGFTDDSIPLAYAVCSGGDITSLIDTRPFYTGVDVKPNLGLARDSEGFYVEVKEDSGIEVDSDGLAVKLKSGGGIVSDSDGLSVDTTDLDFDLGYFGDGSDDDVVISTNTSLARDMYYNNLTVNNGVILNANGYLIYVKGELETIGTGYIEAGAGAVLPNKTSGSSSAPANGNPGVAGSNAAKCLTTNSGSKGGDAGTSGGGVGGGPAGGDGGLVSSAPLSSPYVISRLGDFFDRVGNTFTMHTVAPGAGSGGNGASGGSTGWAQGGAGGISGGVLFVCAHTVVNITAKAVGGVGGAGNNCTNASYGGGGGGGGAGGNGGVICLVYHTLVASSFDVSGGLGGAGGTGLEDVYHNPYGNGEAGDTGEEGIVKLINI